MDSCQEVRLPSIPPPTTENLVVKDRLGLVLELIWLFTVIFPCRLLLCLFRRLFPPTGKSLNRQVVIVTGAGHGLGRGIALSFAKEGAKVAVVDIDTTSAIQTAQTIEDAGGIAKAYYTNIGRVDEIQQLHSSVVRDLGPVDIIINNAGLVHAESLENMLETEIRSVVEINLLSHFWMAQEFLPAMKRRNAGHIVAISSMSALVALGNATAYSASKSGLMGFMDALRAELNLNPTNNIKTTTVFPYFINTSEHYVNQWNLRLPPLSIEEAVKPIMTAVKRDQVVVSVPESMYCPAIILKLLPSDIRDKIHSIILYTRVSPSAKENKDKDPSQRLITEIIKRKQN